MSSRCPKLVWVFAWVIALSATSVAASLKVCADPDNLPFSNSHAQGFDNKIAEILARDLGEKAEFVWQRAGRGFVRENLNKGVCDVLVGVPSQFRPVLTTSPYYVSSFVFVTRKSRKLNIESFDDPRLKRMKIGVQVLEEDYAPPARALSRRGLSPNIVGFDADGEDSGKIIDAVAHNKIDVAVVWGPLAGYYAHKQAVALQLTPVRPALDPPALPFRFAIAVGVRKSDAELRDRLERALARSHSEIERVLHEYGVPHEVRLTTETRRHGEAEAQPDVQSGDPVIGRSGDLKIGSSGNREIGSSKPKFKSEKNKPLIQTPEDRRVAGAELSRTAGEIKSLNTEPTP
jgi:mxaJ protein